MNTYTIKLKEKRVVADQTIAFLFERPEGFTFQAGQYVAITLSKLDFEDKDKKGATRVMSIAAAPSDDQLMFAMRITDSAFKQTLSAMPLGGEVVIRDATGRFVLPADETKPIVFLAGGIGITPVRSILREASVTGRKNPFYLFFSNRASKDVPFAEEMQVFPRLQFVGIDTLTEEEQFCPWQEERGFICQPMVEKYVPNVLEALYYIVGTTGFSTAMKKMLTEELHIEESAILMDPFTGL
ncbi:MAG: FAD-dependent oxidoreductase [Candidatus Moraniibacteriota bacterium]